MTPAEILAALSRVTRELEDNHLTIVTEIVDVNRNVIATYRRTVRLPRHNERKKP